MGTEPLVLIVGYDALAFRVCAELTATAGHDVRVVWSMDAKREQAFRAIGASVAPLEPDSDASLLAAGVMEAATLIAVSNDDGLNLSIALRARSLNGAIRIVLRQFNVTLGAKIEQLLPDSTSLSLAAHSAATYAGAALDSTCFFALRFPEEDGPLVGFSRRNARDLGIAGLTVGQAEERIGVRILALDARRDPPTGAIVSRGDSVVIFGTIRETAVPLGPSTPVVSVPKRKPRGSIVRGLVEAFYRANPILRGFAIAAVFFFSLSYAYFHVVLGKTLTASAFYVVETMTNVGFGEVDITRRGPAVTLGAIAAMLGGIVFTSIFIGSVASTLTRAQWVATQGLRRIRARRHVVVCGGGKIGTAVLNLLTAAGKRVIVIDTNPDADLVRRARERDVDLLTGDATQAGALDLCDLANASAVLALTENDATNLEIVLGVRVRSLEVPLVVRIEDASFAAATTKLFGLSTFSPSALSAPAFAGLSRFPGTRGRVRFANEDHTIGVRVQGAFPEPPPAEECSPLCVLRAGRVYTIRAFEEMKPFDTLLFIVPLGQFRRTEPPSTFSVPASADRDQPFARASAKGA
jgi:Trk K+ transport system NAD-binding subunit